MSEKNEGDVNNNRYAFNYICNEGRKDVFHCGVSICGIENESER